MFLLLLLLLLHHTVLEHEKMLVPGPWQPSQRLSSKETRKHKTNTAACDTASVEHRLDSTGKSRQENPIK